MSLLTMMRSGHPGRTVMVGWMLRLRSVMRWPTWLALSRVDSRIASTRSSSSSPKVSSVPTPGSVERTLSFRSRQVWKLTSSSRPARPAVSVAGRFSITTDEHDDPLPDNQRALLAEGDEKGRLPTRFRGTVIIFADRPARDMHQIVEAIVQQLTTMQGATVELKLEIDAEVPDGIDKAKLRTLLENANTLGFIDKALD